jgi:outer membrane protein assembly factor BamA
MLVGNLELRFPLLRPFGASQRMYGPIPVEVALFADGGLTWNSLKQGTVANAFSVSTLPRAFNLHDGVGSAGVTLRVNLLGFAIGQFDFVRPFQRTNRNWLFQFNLSPGF